MPSITRTVTTTVTITTPDHDTFMQSESVLLEYNYPSGTVSAVIPRDMALATHSLLHTKPDPRRLREVEAALTPGRESTAADHCVSLVNHTRLALADKFAYPVRDSIWHKRQPLHMEHFRTDIDAILTRTADANAQLVRAGGADFSEQLRNLGDHYAKACNRPPSLEALLATTGYTACEVVLLMVFSVCAKMGAAFTAHGITDGRDMVTAAEDARDILHSAIGERTRHRTMQ